MTARGPASPERLDILRTLDVDVEENLSLLAPIERAWQPTDFLPDLGGDRWREGVEAFRASAQNVSDELLVVLVGDMVTEEALPTYSVSLNAIAQDWEGFSPEPWARWLRGWSAEENRHGDLLNAYLRLTGRVDIRAVEQTVHRLIAAGFDPKTQGDPYKGLAYTAFQERATKISHANVGKLAAAQGDRNLELICQRIAGDEARHETFYTRIMGRVLDVDPNGALIGIRDMMRSRVSMPGRFMEDGRDPTLFDHFAVVAQRTGVYTIADYAAIIDHLVETWDIAGRSASGNAARAQDFLCRQAERYAAIAADVETQIQCQPKVPFRWIHDRQA